MVVAAGPAIEGFSNVRVRFDFPARNGLTKFGVTEPPGIERFAADAEKVGELQVGQSEQAHPIRALDKLRWISTRAPNASGGAVRLAPAGLFRNVLRLGDVHQRTGNKRGFPCVLHHSLLHGAFHSTWNGRVLKNFRSADTRDAGLAAQAVEGGQNRRKIIPLIEGEIAKREDKRTDDGGRDLDNKSHRRIRRRAVTRTCTGWGRAPFLAPAKRARLGIAVSQVGDRQRAARNGAHGPPTAGTVEGGAAGGLAKDLRRAAPPTLEWLSTPQASRGGRGRHGALTFGSAAAISSPARAMARQGDSVTAPIALDSLQSISRISPPNPALTKR